MSLSEKSDDDVDKNKIQDFAFLIKTYIKIEEGIENYPQKLDYCIRDYFEIYHDVKAFKKFVEKAEEFYWNKDEFHDLAAKIQYKYSQYNKELLISEGELKVALQILNLSHNVQNKYVAPNNFNNLSALINEVDKKFSVLPEMIVFANETIKQLEDVNQMKVIMNNKWQNVFNNVVYKAKINFSVRKNIFDFHVQMFHAYVNAKELNTKTGFDDFDSSIISLKLDVFDSTNKEKGFDAINAIDAWLTAFEKFDDIHDNSKDTILQVQTEGLKQVSQAVETLKNKILTDNTTIEKKIFTQNISNIRDMFIKLLRSEIKRLVDYFEISFDINTNIPDDASSLLQDLRKTKDYILKALVFEKYKYDYVLYAYYNVESANIKHEDNMDDMEKQVNRLYNKHVLGKKDVLEQNKVADYESDQDMMQQQINELHRDHNKRLQRTPKNEQERQVLQDEDDSLRQLVAAMKRHGYSIITFSDLAYQLRRIICTSVY